MKKVKMTYVKRLYKIGRGITGVALAAAVSMTSIPSQSVCAASDLKGKTTPVEKKAGIGVGQKKYADAMVSTRVFITDVSCLGSNQVVVTWRFDSLLFEQFEICRAEVNEDGSVGEYVQVASVTTEEAASVPEGYSLTWQDDNVKPGITYSYMLRGGYYGESFVYDSYTEPYSVTVNVEKVSFISVESQDESTLVLNWKQLLGIQGYEIYRSLNKDKDFEKIADVSAEVTSFADTALELGTTYYYTIRAYYGEGEEVIYSEDSDILSGKPTYAAVTIEKIEKVTSTKAKLTWTKTEFGEGYEIYRAESKGDAKDSALQYKKIKRITSSDILTYNATKLENGMTYYFKIRAYGTIKDQKLDGSFSKRKKRLMDVYSYDWEPWELRDKRIFGTSGFHFYQSDSAARKNMKTIKIKTWDIDSKGKKYTRTFSLSVHKNIAITVQQIFKEIYEGKEKFPIHDIGGYSWRGDSSTSHHCLGLAIDINPNENYMIQGKKVLVGKLWKPGENPYSIPLDGEVAQIMQKYGFYQGIWGDRRDYMHFSYYGV